MIYNMETQISSERKFLHDIANPIAILKLALTKIDQSYEKESAHLTPEQSREWIKKCLQSVGQLEKLHADHKASIS